MSKQSDAYLRQFDAALQKAGAVDREDIVREIESHLSLAERRGPSALDGVIAELGPPQKLAEAYRSALGIQKVANSSASSKLFGVAARHPRAGGHAAASVVATALLLTIAGVFAVIALLQPLAPESLPGFIGKFMLGGLARTAEATATLGWSLTALGGALALGCVIAALRHARHAGHRFVAAQATLAFTSYAR
jgi:uncharacterized membrane protein